MLQFRDEIQQEYDLRIGSRLITVNTYVKFWRLASDLIKGPDFTKRYTNFQHVIADFLTKDIDMLSRQKAMIAESEWERCASLGEAYLD